MLTENDIVDAVSEYLEALEFQCVCRHTHQHGVDVSAEKGTVKVLIEAKGATPVGGDGLPFTRNQVRTHVAVAFYTAAKLLREPPPVSRERRRVAIALPDNQHHAEFILAIADPLRDLGIAVFWVADTGGVRFDGSWEL
jgi:hypothetical protein